MQGAYIPAFPFRVQYFCPSQAPYWQQSSNPAPILTLTQAIARAQVLKPNNPRGHARVIDANGYVVYEI